jgi:hypothetical protein
MGLKEYRAEETSLQAADCETALGIVPEPAQRTERKIVPFPGAELNHGVNYLNALDDFLKEIGYIE